MKNLIWLLALGLVFMSSAYADDITVTATSGNVDPVVIQVEDLSTVNPGATLTWQINATDDNGEADISSATMYCWGPGSVKGDSDDWDHYTDVGSKTNINTTTNQYDFSVAIDEHAINGSGTWNCTVDVVDAAAGTGVGSDLFTMNTRTGLILNESTFTVSSVPGTDDVEFTNSPVLITHDGNLLTNISILGTNLTGVVTPAWEILVGNITYDATALPGTVLTTSAVVTESDWARGTDPTAATITRHMWIDVPLPLKAQNYAGTITISASAA